MSVGPLHTIATQLHPTEAADKDQQTRRDHKDSHRQCGPAAFIDRSKGQRRRLRSHARHDARSRNAHWWQSVCCSCMMADARRSACSVQQPSTRLQINVSRHACVEGSCRAEGGIEGSTETAEHSTGHQSALKEIRTVTFAHGSLLLGGKGIVSCTFVSVSCLRYCFGCVLQNSASLAASLTMGHVRPPP